MQKMDNQNRKPFSSDIVGKNGEKHKIGTFFLWAGCIAGQYVFNNYAGQKVTVNVDRYRTMIADIFVTQLNGINMEALML